MAILLRRSFRLGFSFYSPVSGTSRETDKFIGGTNLSHPDKIRIQQQIDASNEAVKRIFSIDNANKRDLTKLAIHEAMGKARRGDVTDTGSTDVQISALSARITSLTEHLTVNRSDLHNRRELVLLNQKRRKLLKYLKRVDFGRYLEIIEMFQIKTVERL